VERDKLTSDASFMEDLGADSLDTVELVMPSRRNSTSTFRTRKPRSCGRWDRRCQYLHEKMGK